MGGPCCLSACFSRDRCSTSGKMAYKGSEQGRGVRLDKKNSKKKNIDLYSRLPRLAPSIWSTSYWRISRPRLLAFASSVWNGNDDHITNNAPGNPDNAIQKCQELVHQATTNNLINQPPGRRLVACNIAQHASVNFSIPISINMSTLLNNPTKCFSGGRPLPGPSRIGAPVRQGGPALPQAAEGQRCRLGALGVPLCPPAPAARSRPVHTNSQPPTKRDRL